MLSAVQLPLNTKSGRRRLVAGVCLGGERAASDRSLGPGARAGRGLRGVRPGQSPVASEQPGTRPPRTPLPPTPSIWRPSRLPRTLFSEMGSFSCSADITDRKA